MATCSSDRQVRIWDQLESGEWELQATLSEHSGSIWKVRWAHPEFGNVLATCSFDATVQVWEEKEDNQARRSWRRVAHLVDSRQSVCDISFAPRHMGFKLATASADGRVRIYEALDIMNLSHWPLLEEFSVKSSGIGNGTISISWDQCPWSPPCMILGTSIEAVPAQIWQKSTAANKWQLLTTLGEEPVHSVSWAPNMGRSYHLVAAGGKHSVRIWEIRRAEPSTHASTSTPSTPSSSSSSSSSSSHLPASADQLIDVKLVAKFMLHQGDVWHVDWNITGTILASAGDDGKVRLWKRNAKEKWSCLSTIDMYTDHALSTDVDSGAVFSFDPSSEAGSSCSGSLFSAAHAHDHVPPSAADTADQDDEKTAAPRIAISASKFINTGSNPEGSGPLSPPAHASLLSGSPNQLSSIMGSLLGKKAL